MLNVPEPTSARRTRRDSGAVVDVLWHCAVSAFVKSILITALGGVAIGMAGGIWQEMTPSALPGFGLKPEAEEVQAAAPAAHSGGGDWKAWFGRNEFAIVFGCVFVATAWARLAPGAGAAAVSGHVLRLRRVGRQLSEDWFRLIVGNAFGAMISAIVIVAVQQFTPSAILFGWLVGWVTGGLQAVAGHLFGVRAGQDLGAWFQWYGANQLKFTFWLLYLAAICDDLGIPNLKTLGRSLVRRLRGNREPEESAPQAHLWADCGSSKVTEARLRAERLPEERKGD